MSPDLIPLSKITRTRLRELGLDEARVLQLAGVSPALFHSARPRLSTRQFFAFWQAMSEVSGDPAFGLRLGEHTSLEHAEVILIAALHSADFDDAMRKVARYKRLLCPEEITIDVSGGEAIVHYRWTAAEQHAPATLTDAMFASALGLIRRGTGDATIVPRRIEFTRPAVDSDATRLHANYFGCRVRFGADRDLLVWDAAALHVPFVTHNEDILAMLLPGLEAALREHTQAQSLAEQVGAILGRSLRDQRPSVEAVARQLHISPRTLQRRLSEEGTSYQQELDRVRQQAARHLLTSTDLEAGEIAFFLGFEELNSFTRVFSHWEGMSPNRWRDAARQ
jgi:AraC-like DNA-binding protein